MNDFQLRQADPYDAVKPADLAGADLALLDEIVATPDARLSDWRPKQRTLRGRLVQAGVAAAAVTAMVAVPSLVAQDADPGSTAPTVKPVQTDPAVVTPIKYASAVVKVARANPRILVTAPGWKVRSLEGFDPESGGMIFQLGPDQWRDTTYEGTEGTPLVGAHSNQAPQLDVSWYPADQYQGYLSDRAHESGLQHLSVLGHRSQMVSYSATDHAVMLPPQGAVFIEIRGRLGNEGAFKKFLAESLEQVSVDTWLAAMPDSIVTPDVAAGEAATLLKGIPLPPGFDQAALARGVAQDRYQFGAKVTGAVSCGWLDEWTRARAASDTAAQQRAVDAMATSRDWKVLRDMDVEGDYPEVIWQYADAIAAGTSPAGYRSGLGCPK